jgi:lysophospholipase L1-like esterase
MVMGAGRDDYLVQDGVHFSPEGYTLLGTAVAEVIREKF